MVRKLKKFGKQLLPYIDKPGAVLLRILICDIDGFFADDIALENLAATKKVFPSNRSLCQNSLCRNPSKNTCKDHIKTMKKFNYDRTKKFRPPNKLKFFVSSSWLD
jgi:hypothetical protein